MNKTPNDTLNKKPISITEINGYELESNFVLREIYVKKEINKVSRAVIEIIGDQKNADQFLEINQKISSHLSKFFSVQLPLIDYNR